MKNKNISVGILAGGKSSRMGRNKALIEINNVRIIDSLIGEFSSFAEVIVSAGEKGIYEDTGATVVYDENKDMGPMEGIRRVLASSKSEYVFICAADMPFMKKEIVQYIAGYISSDHDCYVIRSADRIEPLCAIYKRSLIPVIEELMAKGRLRLREILDSVNTKYIMLDNTCFDRKCVRNINTKEELAELMKPYVFCVSGFSNSGKTGLIVKLINEFIIDGYSVSVLKHDGCDCYTDVPCSDTDLYTKAGAVCSAVFTDTRYSLHVKNSKGVEEMLELIKSQDPPPDVVIIEGMKASAYPKIVMQRKGAGRGDLSHIPPDDNTICTVTDQISPEKTSHPVFGYDDVKGIYLCLKEYFDMMTSPDETCRQDGLDMS